MRNTFIATALLACTSVAALAQTTAMPTTTSTTTMPATAQSPMSPPKMHTTAVPAMANPATQNDATMAATSPTGASMVNLSSSDMLSSNIIGLDIYDGPKNDIGKVNAIAFSKSKTVEAYILSVGGFLGMGVHYVAVAPDAVMISYDTTAKKWHGTMDTTKAQIKAMPEFKFEHQWAATNS